MTLHNSPRLVIVGNGPDGKPTFFESQPLITDLPGVHISSLWEVDGPASIKTDSGSSPTSLTTPGPGGSTLLLTRFAANSAGLMDAGAALGEGADLGHDSNPAMHSTNTIDYEYIVSGKIDIVLSTGERRTLHAGDLSVVAGSAHAWENIYDEDCVYVAVMVGAAP